MRTAALSCVMSALLIAVGDALVVTVFAPSPGSSRSGGWEWVPGTRDDCPEVE
jgi:hypothetical protein